LHLPSEVVVGERAASDRRSAGDKTGQQHLYGSACSNRGLAAHSS
jgi:hypothetical protein